MADPERTLEKWLRQQVFRQRKQPLERIILRHASGARGQEVDTFEIPQDLTIDNIPMFRDEILMRAQADADAMGTKRQRYLLVAVEMESKDGARFPFSLKGEGDDEDGDDGGIFGKPDKDQFLGQIMRHNEALMRMLVMTTGNTNQILAKRLEAAEGANNKLIQQRHEYLSLMEEAKTDQHERDIHMLQESGKEDRKNALMKKAESLFPLVVAKLTGQKLLGGEQGKAAGVMRALRESLSAEQFAQLSQVLTTDQQILLVSLLKEAEETDPKNNGVS